MTVIDVTHCRLYISPLRIVYSGTVDSSPSWSHQSRACIESQASSWPPFLWRPKFLEGDWWLSTWLYLASPWQFLGDLAQSLQSFWNGLVLQSSCLFSLTSCLKSVLRSYLPRSCPTHSLVFHHVLRSFAVSWTRLTLMPGLHRRTRQAGCNLRMMPFNNY